ncbi:MAG TPA: FlgD immunoglobulin-like domain containing protein [Gaiellaceae bacterium]
MQRILSTAVIVGLLAATAAAFAITERLKLTKSPINGVKVVREYVSPAAHSAATIRVRTRRTDRVTATIRGSSGHEVDTLAYRVLEPHGWHVFTWNGRDDAGARAPEGTYHLEVHFESQRRTILLPNPMVLETKAPAVLDAGAVRPTFSPDGDHQSDTVTIHYKLSEEAHVVVLVNGHRIIRGRSSRPKDKVSWNGKVNGSLLSPGTYVLTVSAVDPAGNRSAKVQRVSVTLRYIALVAKRVVVRPGGQLRIGVSTDAKRYRWALGARRGTASGRELKLRAPAAAGTYRLVVSERGHSGSATVVVR